MEEAPEFCIRTDWKMRRAVAKLATENREKYISAGCGMTGVILTAIQAEIDRHESGRTGVTR